MIFDKINEIISTKESAFKVYSDTCDLLVNDDDRKLFIDHLIEKLKPSEVTKTIQELSLANSNSNDEDWKDIYGDIDIEYYKTLHGDSNMEIDLKNENLCIELSYLWEERRDREISYILSDIMSKGFKVPYWPYWRNSEFQEDWDLSSDNRIIKGIRSKYTRDQLFSIYDYLSRCSYMEKSGHDDFKKCFISHVFGTQPKIKWLEDDMSFYSMISLMKHNFFDSHYSKLIEKNKLFINSQGNAFDARAISKNVSALLNEEKVYQGASDMIYQFFEGKKF